MAAADLREGSPFAAQHAERRTRTARIRAGSNGRVLRMAARIKGRDGEACSSIKATRGKSLVAEARVAGAAIIRVCVVWRIANLKSRPKDIDAGGGFADVMMYCSGGADHQQE